MTSTPAHGPGRRRSEVAEGRCRMRSGPRQARTRASRHVRPLWQRESAEADADARQRRGDGHQSRDLASRAAAGVRFAVDLRGAAREGLPRRDVGQRLPLLQVASHALVDERGRDARGGEADPRRAGRVTQRAGAGRCRGGPLRPGLRGASRPGRCGGGRRASPALQRRTSGRDPRLREVHHVRQPARQYRGRLPGSAPRHRGRRRGRASRRAHAPGGEARRRGRHGSAVPVATRAPRCASARQGAA